MRHTQKREETAACFVRKIVVNPIAADEIGSDQKQQRRQDRKETNPGPLPQKNRPTPDPLDERGVGDDSHKGDGAHPVADKP
ncbi:hypothetical protein D3C87_1905870 [compost metagenome]